MGNKFAVRVNYFSVRCVPEAVTGDKFAVQLIKFLVTGNKLAVRVFYFSVRYVLEAVTGDKFSVAACFTRQGSIINVFTKLPTSDSVSFYYPFSYFSNFF